MSPYEAYPRIKVPFQDRASHRKRWTLNITRFERSEKRPSCLSGQLGNLELELETIRTRPVRQSVRLQSSPRSYTNASCRLLCRRDREISNDLQATCNFENAKCLKTRYEKLFAHACSILFGIVNLDAAHGIAHAAISEGAVTLEYDAELFVSTALRFLGLLKWPAAPAHSKSEISPEHCVA